MENLFSKKQKSFIESRESQSYEYKHETLGKWGFTVESKYIPNHRSSTMVIIKSGPEFEFPRPFMKVEGVTTNSGSQYKITLSDQQRLAIQNGDLNFNLHINGEKFLHQVQDPSTKIINLTYSKDKIEIHHRAGEQEQQQLVETFDVQGNDCKMLQQG